MAVKADFISILRTTPEGISAFLNTPIPPLTPISTPADAEAAIVAQGVLAANLNTILQTFEGLTPIELILRVGQHSNVSEALLFAGLEYLQTSKAQQDFTILEPAAGQTYLPGALRLRAKAKNGTLTQVAVEIGTKTVALDDTDGVFEGFVTLEELGEYTATFHGLFDDQAKTTKTASVSFTLAAADEHAPPEEQPEPPGGTDKDALKKAEDSFNQALQDFMYAVAGNSPIGFILDKWDLLKAAYELIKQTAGGASALATQALEAAGTALDEAKTLLADGSAEVLDAVTDLAGDAANAVKTALATLWEAIT